MRARMLGIGLSGPDLGCWSWELRTRIGVGMRARIGIERGLRTGILELELGRRSWDRERIENRDIGVGTGLELGLRLGY